MIKKIISDLANRKGIHITKISVTGGLAVACVDYRLEISSKSHVVSTILLQSELDSIEKGLCSGFLELKIKAALDRLSDQLAP